MIIEVEQLHISFALREALERSIDNFLKHPQKNKTLFTEILKIQEIEPGPEAILSCHIGFLYGIITYQFSRAHYRVPNTDEMRDIMELIKGRIHEMREAYLDTR